MPDRSTYVTGALGVFPPSSQGGTTQTYSSFGPENTTVGPEVPVKQEGRYDPSALFFSERSKILEYRERFFTGRMHGDRQFDWNGRHRGGGDEIWATQPLMGGLAPEFYVPLESRRPKNPKRIGRLIVKSFTAMLFGQKRFPQFRSVDRETQDYAHALVQACQWSERWEELRHIAGSCGTAAMSWCFHDGSLILRPHLGRLVHVLEWVDFDSKDPAWVTELVRAPILVEDKDGDRVAVDHWFRRDWTLNEDVVYLPCEVVPDQKPVWIRDTARSHVHRDGFCHIEWVTNENDLEPDEYDGEPDYAEQYESMLSLDDTFSVVVTGGQKNLDPTLVLGIDKSDLAGAVLKKGSDHAIAAGSEAGAGAVKYLELAGTSIDAGIKLFKLQKAEILEDCQCVVPDPDAIAAAGTSGVALEMIYMPMISVSDLHRVRYGRSMIRLMTRVLDSIRRLGNPAPPPTYEVDPEGDAPPVEADADPDAEQEPAVEYYLKLDPRVEEDEDGNEHLVERSPGTGSLTLEWPPYFPMTVQDKASAANALGAANGARPVMSQRTSVETMAGMNDVDPAEEWKRVQAEEDRKRAAELGLTPPIGGDDIDADPSEPAPEDAPPPVLDASDAEGTGDEDQGLLTDTANSVIVTVNEARVSIGLDELHLPDGMLDPDGNLTVAEFQAKREAKGEAIGEALGGGGRKPAPPAVPKPPGLPGFPPKA